MRLKLAFIQLPLAKMAGCPWNLLDDRGVRVARCGTDGNHEKDGELIANDILNLIAIGEAVDELHQEAIKRDAAKDARIAQLEAWKESATAILSECNLQEVGEEIGVPLGGAISKEILPAVKSLKARIEFLEKALRQACYSPYWIRAPLKPEEAMPNHSELAQWLREEQA